MLVLMLQSDGVLDIDEAILGSGLEFVIFP